MEEFTVVVKIYGRSRFLHFSTMKAYTVFLAKANKYQKEGNFFPQQMYSNLS